ncbi:uncharacterized protein LOC115331843 isoform X2 [Ixodes scapularis]|nr:uncharacterized protein LOC115331843 isoform X2 [Ixodes scapularis]
MRPILILTLLVSSLALSKGNASHKRVRLVPPANLSVTCPSSAFSRPSFTLWYYPNGTFIETRDRVMVNEETGALFIQDLTNDDCGLYYCTSLADGGGPGRSAGLTFVEVYTVESKPYLDRAFAGGVAALCVLTTAVFIALVVRFRYRSEEEKKKTVLPVVSRTNVGYDHTESSTSF